MSLGPVMLDLLGTELSAEERELLQHPLVGGVILFSRNYQNLEQLTSLVDSIHRIRDPHLLVAVDHEGGRVQRFREGFTRLPAAGRIGRVFSHSRNRAKQLATEVGWLMASELRSVGIDFSFAPVLDLDYGVCEVIGDRAFHRDPEVVYELSHAYIKGMAEAGMAAVGKHFPGHGAVTEDSHVAIPVDGRSYHQIYEQDLQPYTKLVRENLAAIMPAHVIYPNVDANPAGFSRHWLQDILRAKLRFQGVIFSDDLNMHGASVAGQNYSDRASAAVNAGCDIILICNNRPASIEILDNFDYSDNPVTHARVARMHGRHTITRRELMADPRWHAALNLIQDHLDDPSLELELS